MKKGKTMQDRAGRAFFLLPLSGEGEMALSHLFQGREGLQEEPVLDWTLLRQVISLL